MFPVPPRILSGPENFSVAQDDNVSITCMIEGIPHPTATWYKNQQLIPIGDRYRSEATLDSVTLTFPKAEVEDEAEYTLTVQNPVGRDTFTVSVTVIGGFC